MWAISAPECEISHLYACCMCTLVITYESLHAGKSTLLTAISERDIPIPDHIDIFHLTEEIRASDKTPLQCVMEVDDERLVLCFVQDLCVLVIRIPLCTVYIENFHQENIFTIFAAYNW